MKVGLVGFAGSGKTTVFNTMTGQDVPVGFGGEVRLGADLLGRAEGPGLLPERAGLEDRQDLVRGERRAGRRDRRTSNQRGRAARPP